MAGVRMRGKDERTGFWVFGVLAKTERLDCCIVDGDDQLHNIIPCTLGECAGVVDNYGEDIYEGDLVLIDGNVKEIYVVEYGVFGFMLTHFDADGSIDTMAALNFFKPERLTVVDNVIDRKDKLKWQ